MKVDRAVLLAGVLWMSVLGCQSGTDPKVASSPTPLATVPIERQQTAVRLPFSVEAKKGYTIWGVQPGDRVHKLLEGLPAGSTYKEEASTQPGHRKLVVQNSDGRTLKIMTQQQDGEEIVSLISVSPVSPLLSVEDDGLQFITGGFNQGAVAKKLGVVADNGRFERLSGKQKLQIEFFNRETMRVAALSLNEGQK